MTIGRSKGLAESMGVKPVYYFGYSHFTLNILLLDSRTVSTDYCLLAVYAGHF